MTKIGAIKKQAIFRANCITRPGNRLGMRPSILWRRKHTLKVACFNRVDSPEQAGKTLVRDQGNHLTQSESVTSFDLKIWSE